MFFFFFGGGAANASRPRVAVSFGGVLSEHLRQNVCGTIISLYQN